jgi:NADPH-dependent F420 reductase
VRVGILGGTGDFGKALAARLVAVGGVEVVIGSRDAEKGAAVAAELGAVRGCSNADAARDCDIAVLATNASAALDTARDLADAIGTTPLLSVAAELNFGKGGVKPSPEALSLAERVQAVVQAPVVAGLHSVAASNLAGDDAPAEDTLVCGDDADAKALAIELAGKLITGRAIDAGPLASARTLEGMTAVIININKKYKAHAGVTIAGLH